MRFKSVYDRGYRQRYSEILGMLEDIAPNEEDVYEQDDEC